MEKHYYVYILANRKNGPIYIGVTSDLLKRVHEHKNKLVDGFTKQYNIHQLVFYEAAESIESAITREKQIKKWRREWKVNLIQKCNPEWNDLYDSLLVGGFPPSRE